jgi:drug/metabolite transporter (DMT)-like permease
MRGILLMIVAVGLLTLSDALAKYLAQSYPLDQVLALRHAVVVAVLLAYAGGVASWGRLRTRNWRGQLLRGVLFLSGAALMVASVQVLPLATVTSLTMTAPMFVAALSVPMLGERVNAARWLAILGGFVGVLCIVRPGSAAFEWAMLLALGSALANGLRDLITRRLSRTETSLSQLFWSNVVVTAACFAFYDADWRPLDAAAGAWFLAGGLLNALAHFVAIEAMRAGEAALVAPFRYTALVWASIVGFLVWGHVPSVWVVLGASVIAASGVGMIWMERRARP